MQHIQQVFTSTPKHSSVAVLEPSDIVLEVADCDTPGQTASHALTRQGSDCTSSACVDVSWIKLREQRWFCGWNWTAESLSSQSSSTKNVVTGTANKPVSVNDLAAYAGSASSLQAKVAQSQADIKKLLASLQNFSNRMEKQASISNAVAPADVPSSGYCKVSAHLPAVAKRIAFLSDLPDDVLFKCLSLLSPSCLGAVAQTCSRLRSAASADSLWQPLSIQMWSRLQPQPPQSFKQLYRITWGKWRVALDWLRWARSMGHPSSLSGKVHKGEAITAMSILAVLCDVAPIGIIETLVNLAAPLSVQAFLRGEDAILVSHSLPCLAAMATVPILASILDKVDCARTISKSLPPFSMCFRDNARNMTQALVNLCVPSMAILPAATNECWGPEDAWRSCAWQQGVSTWEFIFAISRGVTQYRSQMEVQCVAYVSSSQTASLKARFPGIATATAASHNEENVAVSMNKTYSTGAVVDCIAFTHQTGMFGLWGSGKSRGFFRGCAIFSPAAADV